MEDYQDRITLATPEGLELELILAGAGSRAIAVTVDLVAKGALIAATALVLSLAGSVAGFVMPIAAFGIYFGYDIAFETLAAGRTPGKRWTGLRVLRTDGRPVDGLSSVIRNVVRIVDGLTLMYLPALVAVLVTKHNQRLGDLAAGTIVVREPQRAKVVAPTPVPPVAIVALDVSALDAQDTAAARAFLARRGTLTTAVRADLAARIAGALRPRVGGAVAGLSDERLIEQVLAAKSRDSR